MKLRLLALTILILVRPIIFGDTKYGFFPSPAEITEQSVRDAIKAIGIHGDVLLLQRNVPWTDFDKELNADSADIKQIRNLLILGRASGLEAILVVDPLNGLNRQEFPRLPTGWKASFADPRIRAAFTNYALRLVREFKPPFLGLASEINTYADFHPQDFPNFLSLYREVYDRIKAESPGTKVFVTFQWEELNSLIPETAGGRRPFDVRWDQVDAFGERLDLLAISSYPFICFPGADKIPSNYYAKLAARSSLPLAVAEGGYISKDTGPFRGSPRDQTGYLNAIHGQIGDRLAFWIYLLMSDFNLESYARIMRGQGQGKYITTLGIFESCGLQEANGNPKEALAVWDGFRRRR